MFSGTEQVQKRFVESLIQENDERVQFRQIIPKSCYKKDNQFRMDSLRYIFLDGKQTNYYCCLVCSRKVYYLNNRNKAHDPDNVEIAYSRFHGHLRTPSHISNYYLSIK